MPGPTVYFDLGHTLVFGPGQPFPGSPDASVGG
jgi:hypothetical protein